MTSPADPGSGTEGAAAPSFPLFEAVGKPKAQELWSRWLALAQRVGWSPQRMSGHLQKHYLRPQPEKVDVGRTAAEVFFMLSHSAALWAIEDTTSRVALLDVGQRIGEQQALEIANAYSHRKHRTLQAAAQEGQTEGLNILRKAVQDIYRATGDWEQVAKGLHEIINYKAAKDAEVAQGD